jgi:hypothetical protein
MKFCCPSVVLKIKKEEEKVACIFVRKSSEPHIKVRESQ